MPQVEKVQPKEGYWFILIGTLCVKNIVKASTMKFEDEIT